MSSAYAGLLSSPLHIDLEREENLRNRLSDAIIEGFAPRESTLAESIHEISLRLPESIGNLSFCWLVIDTNSCCQLETSSFELLSITNSMATNIFLTHSGDRGSVTNRTSILKALERLLQYGDKNVSYEINKDNIIFYQRDSDSTPKLRRDASILANDAKFLISVGNFSEAEIKLLEARKMLPNEHLPCMYLTFLKQIRIASHSKANKK